MMMLWPVLLTDELGVENGGVEADHRGAVAGRRCLRRGAPTEGTAIARRGGTLFTMMDGTSISSTSQYATRPSGPKALGILVAPGA